MTERIRGRKRQEIRKRLLGNNPLCVHCQEYGIVSLAVEIDHIVPLHKGGAEADDNRQGLCFSCHKKKTREDLTPAWRKAIGLDGWPQDAPAPEAISAEAEYRRLPHDIPRSAIPLSIVCGPPGSGKSTYIRNNIGPNDLLIDLDAIQQKLSGLPEHRTGGPWVRPALIERNRQLRALAKDTRHDRAWFIVAAPDPVERAQWANMTGGTVVLMHTPIAECIKRILADPTRAGQTDRMIAACKTWFEIANR